MSSIMYAVTAGRGTWLAIGSTAKDVEWTTLPERAEKWSYKGALDIAKALGPKVDVTLHPEYDTPRNQELHEESELSALARCQVQLVDWQQHNFPGRPDWHPLLGAVEELGELAHAFIKRAQGIRGTPEEHKADIADALADILVYLCDFANSQGVDMETNLDATWRKVRSRDWQKYPKTGKPPTP